MEIDNNPDPSSIIEVLVKRIEVLEETIKFLYFSSEEIRRAPIYNQEILGVLNKRK